MNSILATALAEERHLLERLEAIRAVIRAYGGVNASASSNPEREASGQRPRMVRAPSDTTKKIKVLLIDLLRGETRPTPTRDLISFLDGEGIKIGGKNPVATLSALLSHAREFEPVGRSGWILKSRTPDADTSGAALTGGDAPPLFESQKEQTPAD